MFTSPSTVRNFKKRYKVPKPIEEDIFLMTPERREELGIGALPDNLFEAIQCTEKSSLVKKALGEHIFNKFIENKKIEWDRYRSQVTEYELKRYLPIL